MVKQNRNGRDENGVIKSVLDTKKSKQGKSCD